MVTNALVPAPNGHRDCNGRFLKGNPGGPGNPFVRQVAALKAALFEALTREDVGAVMRTMRDKALSGDVAAARLMLEYSVGKPLPGSTASALDAEITEQLNLDALTPDELHALLQLQQKMQRQAQLDGPLVRSMS
jgi:hypothetical protein